MRRIGEKEKKICGIEYVGVLNRSLVVGEYHNNVQMVNIIAYIFFHVACDVE